MELNELYGKFVNSSLGALGKCIPSLLKKANKLSQEITKQIELGKETLGKVGEPIGAYL